MGIWKMDETLEQLNGIQPDQNLLQEVYQRFHSVTRRKEWLSVRVLLYHLLGTLKEIAYYNTDRPYLKDKSSYISISHTKNYAAVLLSPYKAGVDVEIYGEQVNRVLSKFLSSDEMEHSCKTKLTWMNLLMWSAKETVYKIIDEPLLSMKEHLKVHPFEVSSDGTFIVKEHFSSHHQEFTVHYRCFEDFVLTYCLTSDNSE